MGDSILSLLQLRKANPEIFPPEPNPAPPEPVGDKSDFERVFPWLMEWEGTTYEDDPRDPGGATKFGIDQRSHPGVDIKGLDLDRAKKIYWGEWEKSYASKLRYPLDAVFFNYAVNAGEGAAIKFLQKALGVPADGGIGPVTERAVSSIHDSKTTATRMVDAADNFYKELGAPGHRMHYALKGWLNRDNSERETFLA